MDKVLKQRLIGASILIALAVIFLPMLFDAPDERPTRELTIDLPDSPQDRAPVRRLPLDPDQARRVAPESTAEVREPVRVEPPPVVQPPRIEPRDPVESDIEDRRLTEPEPVSEAEPEPDPLPEPRVPDESVVVAEPEPVVPEDRPAVTEEDSPVSPEPTELPAEVASADGDAEPVWLVQVASFGARESADGVVERLNQLGHVAAIDPLIRGETTLYRVVTGPYAERTDAERARDQVAATVAGVEPIVRAGPPPAGVRAADSEPAAGYAVQVGSFASRNNAVRLRDQLQGHELPAFLHQDQAGSRTIWRVRVGPVSSRAEASALLDQVVDSMPVEGLIVSHP